MLAIYSLANATRNTLELVTCVKLIVAIWVLTQMTVVMQKFLII